MHRVKGASAAAIVLLGSAGLAFGITPAFEILQSVPGLEGAGQSVFDISADGRFATGVGGGTVFRWERGVGVTPISATNWQHTFTAGISADGSRIVSTVDADNDGFFNAAYWETSTGAWTETSMYQAYTGPEDIEGSVGFDVSGDGNTIVGLGWLPTYRAEAVSYDIAGAAWTGLGHPPTASSRASGVNADGTLIGGWIESETTGSRRATLWDNGVATTITPDDGSVGEFNSVSSNGRYVVGYSTNPDPSQNFANAGLIYDTLTGDTQYIPGIDLTFFGTTELNFTDVADNGVAVGIDGNAFFGFQRGAISIPGDGLMWVRDYLVSVGLDMDTLLNYDPMTGFDEWHILTADAISADGTTMGGQMINWTTYETRGWIATIPAPSTGLLLGAGATLLTRRRR